MGFIKKHSKEIIASLILFFLFFLTRLYNITSLPVFTDEAIYLRWAQIAKNDAAWRFISLTDGKQPLFIWLTMIAMKFIQDPLLAGRLISVGAGFMTAIGLFFLGMELFKQRWVGILSSFLYVIFPMAIVYDRMALYDSLVGTFAIWGLYLSVLLVKKLRLDIALILGMTIGAGALNKTNGFFTLYLLPFTLFLFDWSSKNMKLRFIKWMSLALLATGLIYIFYSVLRLSPFFHIITEKNAIFVYPFKEWIQHPLNYAFDNLRGQWDWLTIYMTLPILLLIIISFIIKKEYFREKLLLFTWFVVPFVALAVFGKTLYPRFILFMALYLLPLAAYTLFVFVDKLKSKRLYAIIFIFTIILASRADLLIITDFKNSPLPFSDIAQYNNDWPSGTGVKESITLFKEQSKKGKIFVGTQGTFGLMPYAYELYLNDDPNITLTGFWPTPKIPPDELIKISKTMPVFFVFYQSCSVCPDKGHAPAGWLSQSKLVLEITKPSGNAYLTVYQLQPQ